MKKYFITVLTVLLLTSCKKDVVVSPEKSTVFTEIKIDTILTDSISIRAILTDDNKVWYAGNKGKYGYVDLLTQKAFNGNVAKDTLPLEFRSIAKTSNAIFIVNVGNPAVLYKIAKDGSNIQLVYEERNEKVFYDSMQFWNDTEGIAMGDPTENCLSVIITRNGGESWKKLSCEKLPVVAEGEAAFAASNSNLIIKGNNTWIVSGGKKARVFFSPDKGNSWKVYDTPIVQGKTMTGIFTADFYDATNGFVAGGDYEKQNQSSGNKAITKDGGKTWNLISENKGFGYASCVQYVPNSGGKQLVCVGASGLQYSSDSGQNWKQFSTDNTLYTIRFQNDSTAVAAGKNKIIRIRFK